MKQLFEEAPVGKAEEVKLQMVLIQLLRTSYSDSEGGPPMKKQKIINFVLVKKLLMVKQLKMTSIGST